MINDHIPYRHIVTVEVTAERTAGFANRCPVGITTCRKVENGVMQTEVGLIATGSHLQITQLIRMIFRSESAVCKFIEEDLIAVDGTTEGVKLCQTFYNKRFFRRHEKDSHLFIVHSADTILQGSDTDITIQTHTVGGHNHATTGHLCPSNTVPLAYGKVMRHRKHCLIILQQHWRDRSDGSVCPCKMFQLRIEAGLKLIIGESVFHQSFVII